MAKNRQDNRSDTDLVVHSLTVMGSMKGAGIRTIRDSVRMLQNAQTTLAEKTRDYWTAIASDSVITPDEKKTLWKEWKVLVQEYADLVQSAEEEHQISQVADPLIAYKAAYLTLYTLVVTNLKLFDNMRQNTQLSDRTAFIAAYTDYFAARDALRDAIRDGEDARVEQVARDLAAQAQEQIQRVSLGGMAAASVDYARYGTGLEQRLTQITEAGSNAAFLGLSVGIPYFLTASAYDEWARLLINDPAGLEYLYNIYERVQTTSGGTGGSPVYFYRMKVSATDAQVKSLKNKLLVLDALRSVITLDADLVQIHGDSVFSSDTTIEKSVKDYIGKSIAQLLMGSDGSDAGFDGTTIINGGFIKTDLINVNRLFALEIVINSQGKIKSHNYSPGSGFCIKADGTAEFYTATIGPLNISTRGVISREIKHFSKTDSAETARDHFIDLFNDTDATRTVTDLYASEDVVVTADGTRIVMLTFAHPSSRFEEMISVWGITTGGDQILLFRYIFHSSIIDPDRETGILYEYVSSYFRENSSIIIANFPHFRPSDAGILYIDGDTLKIS